MKSNLPPGMSNSANFVYNIIGASAAVLPTEGINSQLAHALFNELTPLFEAEPDDHDLQQFAQTAGLEINTLGAELARNLPQIKLNYAETDYYSYQNVIKTRRVNVEEKLAEQYAAAKRELSNGVCREIATAVIESVKRELREVFLNSKQGPMYTTRLISSTTNPCLLARFEAYAQHLREKTDALAEELDVQQISAETRLEEARKAIFFNRESKKNAYIQAKILVFQTRLQKDIFARLIEVYKEIRTKIENENDKIYLKFDAILKEIKKILNANDILLCEGGQAESAKSYHWDVISVKDTASEIEINLREIGFETLARDFAKFLLENSAKWLNDSEVNITDTLSDYICDKFEILTRSMPEFLNFRYGKERLTESVTESEIAPRLYRDAKPIFHLDNSAGFFNFPSYGMVSVPANAPELLRGIEAYQNHALANLRFNIRKSSITDRIFWLNTQNGIPLFAYTPIRVYEELYERTINTKEGVGRHLVMNENENWVNLPSPLPEKLWGDTYTNPRQKALNDEARKIFRERCEAGNFHQDEDFFIRCPNLIEKTKNEIANSVIENESEKETDLTDEFLRVLVCEAIVKRGALYLFEKELEDDPWPPFANLMDNADFPEFTMFSRYKNLDAKRQKTLRVKAKTHEKSWPEDKLIINLKKWQGKIAVRKNQLDNEMWKWQNGKDMYNFYRNALLRLNTQISALAG